MISRARRRLAAPSLVALILVAPVERLRSQDVHEHGGRPPQRLGRVAFSTSCSASVQPRFERGVALLHSFWYEEAGKTFKGVAAGDSTCAMSYWGQAMSLLHPLWTPPGPSESQEGLAASERAVRLSRPGTRERAYADAIATYYRDYITVDSESRLIAYESAMQRVAQHYPQDTEARILYALALIAHGQLDAADTTFARQRKAAEFLEPLFVKQPDHPGLAHYLIHAYDYPALAPRGVAAAGRYARIAPSVPHALHMPSHIFTRLGRWEQSIASNLRSADAAREFEKREHLNALWDERGHALDYLVYAYLQEGRDADAKHVLDQAAAVTAVFPTNSLKNDYALAAIPARYALERGRWADARRLSVRPSPAWPAAEAITHFARAVGAARSGDIATARAEVDSLAQIERALQKAGGAQAYWSVQVRIQRLAASAWKTYAEGDSTTALQQAVAAADLEDMTEKHPVTPGAVLPARELYGDLLLELERPAEARRAYEASLARQPQRARSLFGAARAAELTGDRAAARTSYRQYLQLMSKSNSGRTELTLARRALASR